MAFSFSTNRQLLYEVAEWVITGLVLIFGLRYLKSITAYVLMELYRLFTRSGVVSI